MTIKLLIGLTGPARCGKTTAQHIIAERFGLARINLADPIKDALGAMLDLDDERLNGALKETPLPWLGKSPRELMQTLGTEWGRDTVARDFWLRVAEQRLAMLENLEGDAYQGAVVGDIRFPDEAYWLRAHGGTLIHLYRPGVEPVRAHASEAGVAMGGADRVVTNGGDIHELGQRITETIDQIIDGRAA
ncbi:deoxynucleotide monophosphate kinase [Halomonas sp. SL1]|uniref:deoxynucleotide monophosphate kinase family protein n=1 Tax=Halomonas sp. SL1 TaxID=2137478 RepID=UPI000D1729AE|nr:deoxynucleotide monophosphate kinase [Halomonas sp. SL1]RAH37436.1 deoxynucleotide monophosphate kinase [Halomonas sp. SL1]